MTASKIRQTLLDRIRRLPDGDFDQLALEVFQYQATYNPLYAEFLSLLGRSPEAVGRLSDIPFLPIRFFKDFAVKTGVWRAEEIFSSSGTTGLQTSCHELRDRSFYEENAVRGFEFFYGKMENYCFLALLPSYLERTDSSLVYMVDHFMKRSNHSESGFFLYNTQELKSVLQKLIQKQIPVVLLGVSFALLDLAEQSPIDLKEVIVMETGGMKGRRRELIRSELHDRLKDAFQVPVVHSEYGMTELLSQAYSKGEGLFRSTPAMKVLARDLTDPLQLQTPGRSGALNIIDLANLDTCSFIATDDLGRVYEDGSFEVLGRTDNSDVRGCNLLLEETH